MSFQHIQDQPRVISFLQNALREGRIAHAYCFAGPKGSNKEAVALELAKAINCETQTDDACDQCITCRQISHGNHPDVVTIQPDGAFIKIDQVRKLQEQFRYSAPPNVTRVVILHDAHLMRAEAANSLLKFLEEPGSPMIAILLTDHAESILPTILSRCQILRFAQPSAFIKEQQLKEQGYAPALAKILSHVASELPEALEQTEAVVRFAIQWAEQIGEKNPLAFTQIQGKQLQEWINQGFAPLLVELLLLWLRDLMRDHYQEECLFADWEQERKRQTRIWSVSQLLIGIDNALIALRLLQKNHLQPQNILEQMVLATQEETTSVSEDWQWNPL
jgi:DNA polymerase-3 subunit delta'